MTVIDLHAARASYRARAHKPTELGKDDHSVRPLPSVRLNDFEKGLFDRNSVRLGQPCRICGAAWPNTVANLLVIGARYVAHQLKSACLHLNKSVLHASQSMEKADAKKFAVETENVRH